MIVVTIPYEITALPGQAEVYDYSDDTLSDHFPPEQAEVYDRSNDQ